MNSQIIAHRGESFLAPENTLASINLAWELGAKAVEIDIQLTKDNEIVAIHDYNTKRTGRRNKKVKYQTLKELKKLDVGEWHNKKWKGERVPTLKEVLKTVPIDGKLIIEIKSNIKIVTFLKIILESSELRPEQIEIIAFNYKTIVLGKKMMQKYKYLYLSSLDNKYFWKPSLVKLARKVKNGNLDGLNLEFGKSITKDVIDFVKSNNMLFYVWTVNELADAQFLNSNDVDGITTDKANWLTNKLKSK